MRRAEAHAAPTRVVDRGGKRGTGGVADEYLRLPGTCQNFDVANACLAFLNGMDIASRMIETGEIDYALVVNLNESGNSTVYGASAQAISVEAPRISFGTMRWSVASSATAAR